MESIRIKYKRQNSHTEVQLPESKSEANRLIIIKQIAGMDLPEINESLSQDTQALVSILNDYNSTGNAAFNVGPAGTTMRFLTAYFAFQNGSQTLTGSQRMKERPIKILVDALKDLGATISYTENEGYPPIKIDAPSKIAASVSIDGSVSSQYISALMLVAPSLPNGLTLNFEGEVVSWPYIKMTASLMLREGAQVELLDKGVQIKQGGYNPSRKGIENDWSAASYWYSLLALSKKGSIQLNGLYSNSLQGDSVVSEIFEQFGVVTTFNDKGVLLSVNANWTKPNKFVYDCGSCPDLAQTLVAVCLGLGIDAKLTGLSTLRVKETDRVQALKNECEKIGGSITIVGDDIHFVAGGLNEFAQIATYHDHRMAMAFAPLVAANIELEIENPLVVGKSYPTFWEHMSGAGVVKS